MGSEQAREHRKISRDICDSLAVEHLRELPGLGPCAMSIDGGNLRVLGPALAEGPL